MSGDEARLLQRLLADRAFRRRFETDPVSAAREAGFADLASELARADDGDGRRLDVRESRSSAAGVFMAAALEGLGILDFGAADPSAVEDPPSAGPGPAAAPPLPSEPQPDPTSPAPPIQLEPAVAADADPLSEGETDGQGTSSAAGAFPAITLSQVEADRAARLAAQTQADAADQVARAEAAALSPNPDDWEGNLDDEDGGADETDGSNEDEPDEAGGEDDDSGPIQESGSGAAEDQGSDEEGSDDEGSGGDGEDEDEDEGQDEIGEGSRGEDANDDSSDGDSSDGDPGDGSGDDGGDTEARPDDRPGDTSGPDAGSLDGAPDSYPGDDAPREDVAAWMGAMAKARGLPPELPVMTSLVESSLRNLDHGDADSVGLFQMRLSVWNHGDYSGYPKDPDLQLDWFLDHAKAVEKQRLERGLATDDPKQYGEWVADVQRPAEQYRGRYQERLDEARSLLAKASTRRAEADDAGDSAGGDASHDAGETAEGAEFVSPAGFKDIFGLSVGGAKWANLGGPAEHHARALGNWQSDNAWDLGVPVGTPVYAVDDGVIGPQIGSMASRPGDGERLTLNGSENNYWYGHLSKIVVEAGDHVERGELVGYSGASRNGVPHLHIGVEHMDRLP
jgi:murein DD-endopeptidase MepM/ murein hydrolase activator NlpD